MAQPGTRHDSPLIRLERGASSRTVYLACFLGCRGRTPMPWLPTLVIGYCFAMRILSILVLLTACGAPGTPDARYVGAATPTTGNTLCQAGHAVLRLHEGQAVFTPDETTWTLVGTATAGGALQAERVGHGTNKQTYVTRFTGTWSELAASGVYTTPKCSYNIQLERR